MPPVGNKVISFVSILKCLATDKWASSCNNTLKKTSTIKIELQRILAQVNPCSALAAITHASKIKNVQCILMVIPPTRFSLIPLFISFILLLCDNCILLLKQ